MHCSTRLKSDEQEADKGYRNYQLNTLRYSSQPNRILPELETTKKTAVPEPVQPTRCCMNQRLLRNVLQHQTQFQINCAKYCKGKNKSIRTCSIVQYKIQVSRIGQRITNFLEIAVQHKIQLVVLKSAKIKICSEMKYSMIQKLVWQNDKSEQLTAKKLQCSTSQQSQI